MSGLQDHRRPINMTERDKADGALGPNCETADTKPDLERENIQQQPVLESQGDSIPHYRSWGLP
jgi:hypothetical protein